MEVKEYLANNGNKDCCALVKELLEANQKLEQDVINLTEQLEAESALLREAVAMIEELENVEVLF